MKRGMVQADPPPPHSLHPIPLPTVGALHQPFPMAGKHGHHVSVKVVSARPRPNFAHRNALLLEQSLRALPGRNARGAGAGERGRNVPPSRAD